QDWSDLVVHAPPLYIQEKVHPKVLIDDLIRQTQRVREQDPGFQTDLFADFNGISAEAAKTEFYRHDANWSNRMILGDSLQVMASLAEREGLRGKVQCIYIDPPYGIKFNSNFQWSTTSRDVKDGNTDHITREPEQVKAFRDTWRDGIHSYLTYLRDRLTVARDLLTDSGSIFVQIGDENVHRVRALMDEVFGEENFISVVVYAKTTGFSGSTLSSVTDHIIWYGRNISNLKFRAFYSLKQAGDEGASKYREASTIIALKNSAFELTRLATSDQLTSQGASAHSEQEFFFRGKRWTPPAGLHWKTTVSGMARVSRAERIIEEGKSIRYVRCLDDFSIVPQTNVWLDIGGVQSRTDPKIYVVQTATEAIKRCILMSTDVGDLVLDPTCGSGTTTYVSEQWGRRWITIDTSRVALALARARIMGARYPYYLLADSRDGQIKEAEVTRTEPSNRPTRGDIRQGFVYERVPHITLKAIANNTEIDVIWEKYQETLEPFREKLNNALGKTWEEWEIPRGADPKWPDAAKKLHADWWKQRIARQKEIDASIAAKAEFEYLYDRPYDDKKRVRVAGPFTVESLLPHRVLGVDENDELIDGITEAESGYGEVRDFTQMILENLKIAGIQQAHKEDKITFTSITPWPGCYICAEGRYIEGNAENGAEKRAAVFIGPEFGTVSRPDLVSAAREAGDADFDVLI
ncbi:MAG: site-specific DNA-methyltransferase, partial [Syntrophus sp. (in: bacteria)]|nr:site-specific DNA-methyltransferase [Syntrophus sp. (in: bacteria)]